MTISELKDWKDILSRAEDSCPAWVAKSLISEVERLHAELASAAVFHQGLMDRLAAQAELLSKKAEK